MNGWTVNVLAGYSASKRPAHCHISQQLNLGSKVGDSFSLNLEKENQARDLRGWGVGLTEKKKIHCKACWEINGKIFYPLQGIEKAYQNIVAKKGAI